MDEDKGLTRSPKPKPVLTDEAEKAIQSYLWRYIGPSGVVLVLLSGVLGFFIKDIAMQTATQKAYAEVHQTTLEMATKTIEAKTIADLAVKDVQGLQKSAKDQLEKQNEELKQVAYKIADLQKQAEEQSNIIASNPEHMDKIASCLAKDNGVVKAIRDLVSSKEGSFRKLDAGLVELEKARTIKTLQIECKKAKIKSPASKQNKTTFKFPVKEVWIESAASLQSNWELSEKIEGTDVLLTLKSREVPPGWQQPEEEVECKVCAAGF
jgi:hypothetical protein